MYYKVLKDGEIIDVLDKIAYLKHQTKHNIPLNATRKDAQMFLSSDGKQIWHDFSLRRLPPETRKYETVELIEIDEQEYSKIKHMSLSMSEK